MNAHDDQARSDPARDVAPLAHAVRAASWAAGSGVYLGRGAGGLAWAGPERSTLLLGPSRSGKTSSLVIPNVLAAPGAVVSTSTKPDVLRATAAARGAAGWTLLYDPGGTVEPPPGVVRVGWSPVNAAREWDGALSMADAMARSARRGDTSVVHDDHWSERATSLLAPLLHAAALDNASMGTVVHWVDRHDGSRALNVLSTLTGDRSPPTDVLAGIVSTDGREQSGIWSTASGILAAYRSSGALASTCPPYFDADAFCAGANTLYLCATGSQQHLLAPLVVGLLSEVRDAAYRRARDGGGSPPVLLALDEVANIAPIPELPALVSEGAGQGLLTLASLQDLSQARRRWGRQADAFLSLFGTTVVLGGIADLPTLEAVATLAGEAEFPTKTVGTGPGPDGRLRPSVSWSTVHRPRLPVDVVARGLPQAALALDAGNRVGWIGLTPAHATDPWRRLIGAERTRRRAGAAERDPPAPPLRREGRGR
jgi:type IV secretory pathway TraG/TraD family ATPase VirD4